jgi:PAS domain S-box-containing protein
LTGPVPSSSDLNRFFNELQLKRDQSDALFDPGAPQVPEQAETELIAALEELNIAEEELRAQHEALLDAHRNLEIERERYRTLFEFAPDPYLVTDRDGLIEEANAAAAELLGIDAFPPHTMALLSCVAATSRQTVVSGLEKLASSARLEKWDIEIIATDGRVIPVEATVSVRRRGGGAESFCWLLRDIGDRRGG